MTSFEFWPNKKRREDGTVNVISMCSFTCMHCACESGVPRAVVAHFHSKRTFCTKQDFSPSATPQSPEALVCACSLVTAYLRKAHLIPSGMTSIYTAVCKVFQRQTRKQKILCMKCLVVQDI